MAVHRKTLGAFAGAVFALAGCEGAQSGAILQNPTRASIPQKTSSSYGDLLYASISGSGITVVTYPQGEPVEKLNFTGPEGLCSDAHGNVWVYNYRGYVYEYAHGGKRRIAVLDTNSDAPLTGCAVDSATGNLAVIAYPAEVFVYQNGSGSPAEYSAPFRAYKCGYDDNGDLFVDGIDYPFQIAELQKGSDKFTTLTFRTKQVRSTGSIQWDGQYMAVSTVRDKREPIVYRFKVSGSSGTIAQTIRLTGAGKQTSFWILGNAIVAQTRRWGNVGSWSYPAGGKVSKLFGIGGADGVTISVAPSKTRTRR